MGHDTNGDPVGCGRGPSLQFAQCTPTFFHWRLNKKVEGAPAPRSAYPGAPQRTQARTRARARGSVRALPTGGGAGACARDSITQHAPQRRWRPQEEAGRAAVE